MLVNIVTFFCGRSLGGGRKIPLTASLTLAMKSQLVFNNSLINSNFIPAYCPGPRYLKRLSLTDEIGRPVLTQRMDDLTGFPPVE